MHDKLPCQKLKDYKHPKTGMLKVPLPSDFFITPNPKYEDSQESLLISTARNFSVPESFISEEDLDTPPQSVIPSCAGSHALTCKASVPLKKVGFLSILP